MQPAKTPGAIGGSPLSVASASTFADHTPVLAPVAPDPVPRATSAWSRPTERSSSVSSAFPPSPLLSDPPGRSALKLQAVSKHSASLSSLTASSAEDEWPTETLDSLSFLQTMHIVALPAVIVLVLAPATVAGTVPLWLHSRAALECAAAFAAMWALSTGLLLLAAAWRLRRSLAAARDALRAAGKPGLQAEPSDPIARFIVSVSNAATIRVERSTPVIDDMDTLALVRCDLSKYRQSSDGHVVADRFGVILWCNSAMGQLFGYEEEELVGQNVRVLMPQPYSQQHDHYLLKYDRLIPSKLINCSRRAPVVLKDGTPSTATLAVTEKVDPRDPENYVFIGHISFGDEENREDPATVVRRKVASNMGDIQGCLAELDSHPDSIIVINAKGIIQYANDAATMMLGYGFGGLHGQNVSCLMMDNHASVHDEILARYQEKAAAAARGAPVESGVVGKSRDFYAKTRDGRLLRILLTVKRVDRSAEPCDCLFVGTLLLVQEAKDTGPGHTVHTVTANSEPSTHNSSLHAEHKAVHLTARKITVVVVDIGAQCLEDPTEYHHFLHLLASLCTRHKASLQTPVGPRIIITLNVSLSNLAHRTSAGALIQKLLTAWRAGHPASPLQPLVAAACGECTIGTIGKRPVLVTQVLDLCEVMIRVAKDAGLQQPIIEAELFSELQYTFNCRVVNAMTLRAAHCTRGQTVLLYEVMAAKQVQDDEWMYQLANTSQDDSLNHWKRCWAALGAAVPDLSEAIVCLQHHLTAHPDDGTAVWLTSTLHELAAQRPTRQFLERVGQLEYVVRFAVLPEV